MNTRVNGGPSISTTPNIVNEQVPQNIPAASTPLAGTEVITMTQSGGTVNGTAQDVANLAGGSSLSTSLSTTNSNLTSLSTSASTGVVSLSTGLSTTNSNVTSLSTATGISVSSLSTGISSLSTSTSTAVVSLSTAIGGGGSSPAIRRVTTNTTMNNTDGSVVIDAGVAVLPGLTLTLPPTPSNGQTHTVMALNNFATNTFTVNGNGHNIVGDANSAINGATFNSSINSAQFLLVYDTADTQWYCMINGG